MAPTINITERLRIVEMWQNGGRASDIAKEMGLTRRTVYWWIKRHAVEGIEGLRDRPRGSRGRATTTEQDKALLEAHNNKSMRSTRDFAIKYNVSMETIRRRLREFNNGRPLTNRKKKCKKNPNTNADGPTAEMHNLFTMVMHKDSVNGDGGMRTYTTLTPQRQMEHPMQQYHPLPSRPPPVREVIKCTFCKKDIVGARYRCIQCADANLCLDCESSGLHPEHCVMRLPNEMVFAKVMPWLKPLKMALSDKRKIRPLNDRRKTPRPLKEKKRKNSKILNEKRKMAARRKMRNMNREPKEEPEMHCLCHNLDTIPPLTIPTIHSIPSIPPIPQIEPDPIEEQAQVVIHQMPQNQVDQPQQQITQSQNQIPPSQAPIFQSQAQIPQSQPQMYSMNHMGTLHTMMPSLQPQIQPPLEHKPGFSHFRLPYQPNKPDKDIFNYANPLNYVKKSNGT